MKVVEECPSMTPLVILAWVLLFSVSTHLIQGSLGTVL